MKSSQFTEGPYCIYTGHIVSVTVPSFLLLSLMRQPASAPVMLHVAVLCRKPGPPPESYSTDLSEEIGRESAGAASTRVGMSLKGEPGHLTSSSASGGVSSALTSFSSLIKDAFHMTARKGRKKTICEEERGGDLKILQNSAFS